MGNYKLMNGWILNIIPMNAFISFIVNCFAECTHWHTAEVKKRLTHCIGNNLSVRLAVGPGVSLNGSYTGGMSVSMSNNYV